MKKNIYLIIFQELAKVEDGKTEKSDDETEKKPGEEDDEEEGVGEEEYEEEDIEEVRNFEVKIHVYGKLKFCDGHKEDFFSVFTCRTMTT